MTDGQIFGLWGLGTLIRMPSRDQSSQPTWRSLAPATRREVLRLANEGRRHPDPTAAAAAEAWANHAGWNRLANRIPGWILPAISGCLVIVFVAVGVPVLAIFAVIPLVMGLLGWVSTAAAATVRAVPPADANSMTRRDS